MSTSETRIGRP